MAEPSPATNPQTPKTSLNDAGPEEIYKRMEAYAAETDGLISLLHNTLAKGEAQLSEVTAYDSRVKQLGNDLTPIDPAALQNEIDDVRKHITALESFRDRIKIDMENVKTINERISKILSQYQDIKKSLKL